MSTRYPADDNDALFMNDGPLHAWWSSPDLWFGPAGGPPSTVAQPGSNQVSLRLHKNAESFDEEFAKAELFVGNPSLYMSPTVGTVYIGSRLFPNSNFSSGGGSQVRELAWIVPTDASGDSPSAPGHRCLIARVFPNPSSRPADFQVPTDQHEAQRNITIAAVAMEGSAGGAGAGMAGAPGGPPMGPGEEGLWEFRIDTATPVLDGIGRAVIRATWLERLPDKIFKDVAPLLGEAGFRDFAPAPPEKFLLDFQVEQPGWEYLSTGEFSDKDEEQEMPERRHFRPEGESRPNVLEERPEPRGRKGEEGHPLFEVDLELEPERLIRFAGKGDLRALKSGMGTVIHFEQLGEEGESQGGYTLILVMQD